MLSLCRICARMRTVQIIHPLAQHAARGFVLPTKLYHYQPVVMELNYLRYRITTVRINL
jgi:hypothetical protein